MGKRPLDGLQLEPREVIGKIRGTCRRDFKVFYLIRNASSF